DGHQGVPVVRGGDGDDVDVLVLDHPADVLLVLRGFPLRRFDPLHRVADDCLVAVAHDGDLGVDVPVGEPGDVAHAPAVDADDGAPQAVVGGAGPGGGERLGLGEGGSAGGGRGGEDGGAVQEFTTAEDVHRQLLGRVGERKSDASREKTSPLFN